MLSTEIKDKLYLCSVPLQTIVISDSHGYDQVVDILRLDRIHPEISGNKWFKLRFFLEDFLVSRKSHLATFGGCYSNHIAASAAAAHLLGIPITGFIRGEEPVRYSPTLQLAKKEGMNLQFLSRADYKEKERIMKRYPDFYWIAEGGYGILGANGAATIWEHIPNPAYYSHIFLAAGTGTTTAGLVNGSLPAHEIMSVSVMKNNISLFEETAALIPPEKKERYELLQAYHFGGYAKKTPELIDFMNMCWDKYSLPLDFVYTAKAFFALYDFVKKNTVNNSGRILFIHTGGLQGNRSLPNGLLNYS